MKYERSITLIFFALLIAMLVSVHGIRQTVIKQKYELHDAKFQLDMATDHIELINAGH